MMKPLTFEVLLEPEMLIKLAETWVVLDINEKPLPKTEEEGNFDFYVYRQRVSCKIGAINLLEEYKRVDIYFIVPPVLDADEVEEIRPLKIVCGKRDSGLAYSYVYADIYENGEQVVDKCFDCLVSTNLP